MHRVAAVHLDEAGVGRQRVDERGAARAERRTLLVGEQVERGHLQLRRQLEHPKPGPAPQRGEDPLDVAGCSALDVLAGILLEPGRVLGKLAANLRFGIRSRSPYVPLEGCLVINVVHPVPARRILGHQSSGDPGPARHQLDADGGAERMADQEIHRCDSEAVQRGREISGEGCRGGDAVDRRALPVSALIDGDHAPAAIGKGRADAPPGSPPAGDAVDEHGNRRGRAGIGASGWPFVRCEHDGRGHASDPSGRQGCGPRPVAV